jgi:hypothetical protein
LAASSGLRFSEKWEERALNPSRVNTARDRAYGDPIPNRIEAEDGSDERPLGVEIEKAA